MKPTSEQIEKALDRLYAILLAARVLPVAGWVDDLALLEQVAAQRNSLIEVGKEALATFEHHEADLSYLGEFSVVTRLRRLLAIGEEEEDHANEL